MKGLTMAQWVNNNLNRNNRSVLAHQYSVLWEKFGSISPPLVGLMAERPADEIWVDIEILNLFYRLSYSDFYLVYYHCNFTAVLELHSVGFCRVKVCVLKWEKFGSHYFSCQPLLLGTNVPNDILIINNQECPWIDILMAAETICMGLLLLCWTVARLYRVWQKRDCFSKPCSQLLVCWDHEWKIYYQIAINSCVFKF